MKPTAWLALLLVLAVASAVMFLTRGTESPITISDAALVPMGAGHALTLSIDNPGDADVITGITVETAEETMFPEAGSLTVPGGDTAQLAMDGVHPMVMGLTVEEGQLIPVSVTFTHGETAQARARVSGASAMDHSEVFDVPATEPQPSLTLDVQPSQTGWSVTLQTEDFEFSRDAVDGDHAAGEGHAHLYLNGLKLGRIYDTDAEIGALPKGDHEISVTLNTNDHRAYAVDGAQVTATVTVTVD